MTIVAGVFLLLDLVPHLMEEFGGTPVHLSFLPFDPSWVTIIIRGIPLLYLAIWRIIYNRGIAKISSALLICMAEAWRSCWILSIITASAHSTASSIGMYG